MKIELTRVELLHYAMIGMNLESELIQREGYVELKSPHQLVIVEPSGALTRQDMCPSCGGTLIANQQPGQSGVICTSCPYVG